MAGRVSSEVINLHNDMIFEISREIAPVEGCQSDWERLLFLFNDNPISRAERASIKSIQELFEVLMKHKAIDYGDYMNFIEKVDKINRRIATVVQRYTEKIRIVMRKDQGLDSSQGGLSGESDWQLYLDIVSSMLSAEIKEVATYLQIDSDKQREISEDNPTAHERCFQTLWHWFLSSGKSHREKEEELKKALRNASREDVADIERKPRCDYRYGYTDAVKGADRSVSEIDIQKVASEININFTRMVRYFGLEEKFINEAKRNDNEIQRQAATALQKCLQQKKIETRQKLCDGLNYIQNINVIKKLGW